MANTSGLLVSARFCNFTNLLHVLLTGFIFRAFKYTNLNSHTLLCNTLLALLVRVLWVSSVPSYSHVQHEFISSLTPFVFVPVSISLPISNPLK